MPADEAVAGTESRAPSHYLSFSLRSRRSNRQLAEAAKTSQHEEPPLPRQQPTQEQLLQHPQQAIVLKPSKRSLRHIFSRSKLSKDKSETHGRPATTSQSSHQHVVPPTQVATVEKRSTSAAHLPLPPEPTENIPLPTPRASSVPRSRSLRRQSHALPALPTAMPGRKGSLQYSMSHESLAAWEMPQLFKAFPQTVRQATLPAVTMHTEMVLRLHEKSVSAAAESLILESSNTKEKSRRKHAKNPSLSNLQWTTKIYLLVTSGYLLQYSGLGNYDRLPEKVLKLSQASAAFVTDSIPGKHWVLQVSATTEQEAVTATNEPKSLLSKLALLTADKRETANMLMVFENPDDLDSWMITLRSEIEKLGGKPKTSETGAPQRQLISHGGSRTTPLRNSRHFPQNWSRSSSDPRESYDDGDSPSNTNNFQHSRQQSLDDLSTTNSVVSQDGRQLDSLRDSNGNRLSFVSSDRRTAITSAASSPAPSPIAENFPRISADSCDYGESTKENMDGKPRSNPPIIASRRPTLQNAGLYIDVSSETRRLQHAQDPFLSTKVAEPLGSPTGPIALNFSVPKCSSRRFSHVRLHSSASQPPTSPNNTTYASRCLRSKPQLILRSSRPLSMVADAHLPRTEIISRPPTADGTSRQGLSPVKERRPCSRRHSPRGSTDDILSPRLSVSGGEDILSPGHSQRTSPRGGRLSITGVPIGSPRSDLRALRTSQRLSTIPQAASSTPVFTWTDDKSRRRSIIGPVCEEPLLPHGVNRRASLSAGLIRYTHRRHSSSDEKRPELVLPPMPPPPSGPLPSLPGDVPTPMTDKQRAVMNRRSLPQMMPPPAPPPLRDLPPLPHIASCRCDGNC